MSDNWEQRILDLRRQNDSLGAKLLAHDVAEAKRKAEAERGPPPPDPIAVAQKRVADDLADPEYLELIRQAAWLKSSVYRKTVPSDPALWPKGTDAALWLRREHGLTDNGEALITPSPDGVSSGSAEPTYLESLLTKAK